MLTVVRVEVGDDALLNKMYKSGALLEMLCMTSQLVEFALFKCIRGPRWEGFLFNHSTHMVLRVLSYYPVSSLVSLYTAELFSQASL